MPSIVFVHGTGVRQPAYDKSFAQIKKSVARLRDDLTWVRCYWGDEHGASLNLKGKSIPDYDTARAVSGPGTEFDEIGEWALLYDDPLLELRLLANQAAGEIEYAPGGNAPWYSVKEALEGLAPDDELNAELDEVALRSDWIEAYRAVAEFPQLNDGLSRTPQIQDASDGYDTLRHFLARAIIAGLIAQSSERGGPVPDAKARDTLVEVVRGKLGARDEQTRSVGGLMSVVSAPVVALGARTGTAWVRRKRGSMSDAIVPFPCDVLVYQTRGEGIRSFIHKTIESASPPVYVLAHSLGGIATFELLATPNPPQVAGLITAGSQIALMYEVDCLPKVRLDVNAAPEARLPKTFPRWMNFYDANDLLGYVAKPVFGSKAEDIEVTSGQPFPWAHSAYWNTRTFAEHFAGFVN